jgi:ketosteroid isomerase-like protein
VSQENMEIVRRLYERWGRGDAALDLLDPEIEIAMPVGRPDEQRYHGPRCRQATGCRLGREAEAKPRVLKRVS